LPIASGGQSFEFRYSAGSSGVAKTPLIVDYNDITALTNFKASGNIETSSKFIASGDIETGSDIGFKGSTGTKYIYFPDTGVHTGQLNMQAGFGSGLAGGALTLFGQNHATKAGSVNIGVTAIGSKFTISDTAFGGGAELASVDRSGNGVFLGTVSASPATLSTELVTKGQLDAAGRPYKVYVALLDQAGTAAPVPVVLENTLGFIPTYSYAIVGIYAVAGTFPLAKTSVTIQNTGRAEVFVSNPTSIQINSRNSSGALADGWIARTMIEIRVYP